MLFRTLKPLFFIALVIAGPWLFATRAHADAPFLSLRPVFSDFDGDHGVDQARLYSHGSHKQIHVHLKSSAKTLSFDSGMSDPGSLLSGDIDRDGDADLIWMSQSGSPVVIFWMGDGHGNFTFISNPAAQSRLRKALLYGNTGWSAIHTSTEDGPDGVVPSDDAITPQASTGYIPVFVPRQNLKLTHEASAASPVFLFALQKRGPPSPAQN
jgi:hypothetical protein